MKIVFTRNEKIVEVPAFGPSEAKLYAVDTAYSADGYFAAVWAAGELEPVPACSPESVELLAHVVLASDAQSGALALREIFCAQGVSHALD